MLMMRTQVVTAYGQTQVTKDLNLAVSDILFDRREPNSSLRQCLPAMAVMHKIEQKMTS